jgi:hypothetical protein
MPRRVTKRKPAKQSSKPSKKEVASKKKATKLKECKEANEEKITTAEKEIIKHGPNNSSASAGATAMKRMLTREDSSATTSSNALTEFITKKNPSLAKLPQLSTNPKGVKDYLRTHFGLQIS